MLHGIVIGVIGISDKISILNFNDMDTLLKKTQPSKGERLNWAKVQKVEHVKIIPALVIGKLITEREHAKRNRNSKTLLVP